jgi:hypothetical protein
MSDNDAVTWGELKAYCTEKRLACRALTEQEAKTKTVSIEAALDAMREEIAGFKRTFDGKHWVIQRPIFALCAVGLIAVGVAGKELIGLAVKWVAP